MNFKHIRFIEVYEFIINKKQDPFFWEATTSSKLHCMRVADLFQQGYVDAATIAGDEGTGETVLQFD